MMADYRAALAACRVALARLELTATGTTPNVGGTGGGHPASAPPPVCGSGHWELRRRLRDATTIEELARIERAATLEWEHLTGRGTADLERGDGVTLDQLVLEAVSHDAQAVAWRWSIDIARVRRIRARAKLDPETGRPAEAVAAEARGQDLELRRAKAARMDAAGMSLKQIALATGCSTATVRADLGRRAA
jgi:hypothetical protein